MSVFYKNKSALNAEHFLIFCRFCSYFGTVFRCSQSTLLVPLDFKSLKQCFPRTVFQSVIQRLQIRHLKSGIFFLQSFRDHKISDLRVFRQKRSMKICSQNLPVIKAFPACIKAVAASVKHLPQRVIHPDSLPAMVFKTHHFRVDIIKLRFDNDISDTATSLSPVSVR